ncbi:hypothetical protein MMC22_002163 [Lobaria immixta]|nr:hypothetical protein [Lobaria immixta]
MATAQAIVTKALNNLKSSITPEDARTFKDATLQDLWKDAREIEREQGTRLALRHMGRIEPILRSLESYSSVIDSLCQGFSPMAWVWGPIKMMLMLARQHATVMDKILQAFSDIAAVLPRMDKLKETFGDNVDFQQVLSLIYSDILEFHRRVYKFFRRKAWHFWFAFDWGLFERRFKSILEKLSSHCDLLDKEAAAIHFFEMKKMRDLRQREDEEFEERRQRQLAQEVLSWLSAAEDVQEEHLHNLADKRQPGTCDWILDDDQMVSWVEDEKGDPIFWMTGIPGAGKSFLSSLIIQNLHLRDDHITLYYFCSQSSGPDSCSLILRTLANQLVRENLDLAPLIHHAYRQKGSTLSSPAMKKLLKRVLSTVKSTRIVLDGVDECDYNVQKEVLSSLIELQKHAGENCKILVSSRETTEIYKAMEINKAVPAKMHMKLDGKTAEALHLYIQEKVNVLKECFPNYDPDLFQRVEQRLQEKADGMFLWVYLVSTMLEHQSSELKFENAIVLLPEGLDAAYGLILDRFRGLDRDRKHTCFKILFWVCTAYRSIYIHEVADGVALEPGQTTLSRKTRIQDVNRDILEICAPIIEKSNKGILDLVHFSAKEYLLDQQSGPFVEVAQAHFNVAFSCIANLNSTLSVVPRHSGGMTEVDLESIVVQGGYGLQRYGQHYWAEHVLAYLDNISSLDDQSQILISALNEFSKVRRHNSAYRIEPSSKPLSRVVSNGLKKLAPFPPLHDLIAGWLHFKSQLEEKASLFESIDAQQKWQLLNDGTYLSLIDSRLRVITERLLNLNSSKLPSHIIEDDFMAFVSRYGFLCRFHNCTHHFKSRRDRDVHEVTHIPSFLCPECDFSERGFRSSKDLEKHVQRYHMSMEDFEVPNSLSAADVYSRTTTNFANQSFAGPGRSSRCWNEQGRKVLQHSFKLVFDRLSSELRLAEDQSNSLSSSAQGVDEHVNASIGDSLRPENVFLGLENIQEKINEERYHTLAEFKDDIRQFSNNRGSSGNPDKLKEMEIICDQELEKSFAAYPAFANFSPKFSNTSKDVNDGNFSDMNRDPLQDGMESNYAESLERKPYWSSVEKSEFPDLIERYGRDYIKISDYLKTKTPVEVEQHLSTGGEDLSRLADAADIKLRPHSQPVESLPGLDSTPAVVSLISDPAHDSSQSVDQYLTQTPDASFSYISGPDFFTRATDEHPALIGDVQGSAATATASNGDRNNERKIYKRRPPPRAWCTLCTNHPDGLHNDHSLKKHIRSIHTATRKVWICVDISIDKMFLAKCKKCSSDKRYRSKLNAANHLKAVHFSEKTRMETLLRWMEEIEERNPSYVDRKTNPSTNGTDLPRLWQVIDRQETHKTPSSKTDLDHHLAPLQNILDQPSHSSRSLSPVNTSESEEASDDEQSTNKEVVKANALNDDILFPDIPFDTLLPSFTISPVQINSEPEIDRATRALIRPDHVQRLPHLDSFRMDACQDQVDALYERLNREGTGSPCYQEALDSLTHLSRTLRQNLVDWRRLSSGAPAPIFPVKI